MTEHTAHDAMNHILIDGLNQAHGAAVGAQRRLDYERTGLYEARQDLASHGEAQPKPSAPWIATLFTLLGLGVVYGVALYELVVRLYIVDPIQGLLYAAGLGALLAGASVFGIMSAARAAGRAGKALCVAGALIGALALFLLRMHLSGGNMLVAAGWTGLDLLLMLVFEGAAFNWSAELAEWRFYDGPREASVQAVAQAQASLEQAASELELATARRDALLEAMALRVDAERHRRPVSALLGVGASESDDLVNK